MKLLRALLLGLVAGAVVAAAASAHARPFTLHQAAVAVIAHEHHFHPTARVTSCRWQTETRAICFFRVRDVQRYDWAQWLNNHLIVRVGP